MEGIKLINSNAKELNLEIDKEIGVAESCFKEEIEKFSCNIKKRIFFSITCLVISIIIIIYFFIIEKEINLFYITLSYFYTLLIVVILIAISFIPFYVSKKDLIRINGLYEYIESLKWLKTRTSKQKRKLIELKNVITK